MPSQKTLNKNRERLIWGEVSPRSLAQQVGGDDEIQEISPPPGYRRQTYPFAHNSASLSQSISGLTQSPTLTHRRRPRGPDVGKSIHKAAEASQTTPSSAISHSQDRRRSVTSAKRIIPSLVSDISPTNDADSGIRNQLATGIAREAASEWHPERGGDVSSPLSHVGGIAQRTRKQLATKVAPKTVPHFHSEPRPRKRKLDTQLESDESGPIVVSKTTLGQSRGPQSLSEYESYPLHLDDHFAENVGQLSSRTPSPMESAASTTYQIQLARKTASRNPVGNSDQIVSNSPSLPAQRIKAARKNSVQDVPFGLERSESESWDSDDAGEDSPSSSSSAGGNISDNGEVDHKEQVPSPLSALELAECPVPVHAMTSNMEAPGSGYISRTRSRSVDSAGSAPPYRRSPSRTSASILALLPPFLDDTYLIPPSPSRASSSNLGTGDARERSIPPSTSNIPGNVDPPQALLSAFESISAYTVHLHKTNSLPFLLRNVRAGFRSWCRELHITSERDRPLRSQQVALVFQYTDPSGELHTYNTNTQNWECPLCSLFGLFPSWEALKLHVRWDHGEVELEARTSEDASYEVESFIVKMKVQHDMQADAVVLRGTAGSKKKTSTKMRSKKPKNYRKPPDSRRNERAQSQQDGHASSSNLLTIQGDTVSVDAHEDDAAQNNEHSKDIPNLRYHTAQDHSAQAEISSNRSQSQSRPQSSISIASQQITTSNETSNSHQPSTPERDNPRKSGVPHTPGPIPSSVVPGIPSLSPESHSPVPPPLSDPHGPSLPVSAKPGHSSSTPVQITSYRPTGPHLYDHLASLPLDVFGPRSWFVLDKEEEIFELTDVLDEDKVMCALWGRWILLNRSFFIANYILGVEAFIDEYWLTIHQAAGWGALRAWLLMLVSRRFLKNIEMVQVLKKYNGLVGKSKWPKGDSEQ